MLIKAGHFGNCNIIIPSHLNQATSHILKMASLARVFCFVLVLAFAKASIIRQQDNQVVSNADNEKFKLSQHPVDAFDEFSLSGKEIICLNFDSTWNVLTLV